jgi:putative thioredoxin
MSESPYIHNVNTQNFQSVVLDNSMTVPVLVDFWADWCQPCQTLMPMLAKLAEEYGGKFILAKVNSDDEQELAGHFGVKSLPTMKLFVGGQVVAEKVGVVPEPEIRAFIDQYVTSDSASLMLSANTAFKQGDMDEGLALMNQALALDPTNADLKINMATVVMSQGDKDSALALLDSLSDDDKKKDEAVKLLATINLSAQLEGIPSLEEIESDLSKDPNNLLALLNKSTHLSAQGDHESAMECLLTIFKIDQQFEDGAARKGLFVLFDMLGGENAAVQKYRRKLFTLLH